MRVCVGRRRVSRRQAVRCHRPGALPARSDSCSGRATNHQTRPERKQHLPLLPQVAEQHGAWLGEALSDAAAAAMNMGVQGPERIDAIANYVPSSPFIYRHRGAMVVLGTFEGIIDFSKGSPVWPLYGQKIRGFIGAESPCPARVPHLRAPPRRERTITIPLPPWLLPPTPASQRGSSGAPRTSRSWAA